MKNCTLRDGAPAVALQDLSVVSSGQGYHCQDTDQSSPRLTWMFLLLAHIRTLSNRYPLSEKPPDMKICYFMVSRSARDMTRLV